MLIKLVPLLGALSQLLVLDNVLDVLCSIGSVEGVLGRSEALLDFDSREEGIQVKKDLAVERAQFLNEVLLEDLVQVLFLDSALLLLWVLDDRLL